MTLAELAISSAVLGVLSVAMITVVISSSSLFRERIGLSTDDRSVSVALDALARQVRTVIVPTGQSEAVLSATPGTMTFYSLVNRADALVVSGVTVPSKIELYIGTGCVRMAVTPARLVSAGTYAWDTGRTVLCLARTGSTATLGFSYYTSSTATTALTVGASGLTGTERATVRSVDVSLQLSDPQTGLVGHRENARVTLTNLVTADLA